MSENEVSPTRDTWCPVPWVGLGVRSVGDLRYCCHANGSATKGLLTKSDGTLINLEFDSIAQGRNAELIKDVRRKMVNGERHPSCGRCYIEEDAKIFSRRQSEQVTWEKEITKEVLDSQTAEDGSVDEEKFPLFYLDLRFGNRCNLRCRMCSPTESDKWYEAHTQIWHTNVFKEGERRLEILKDQNGRYNLKVDPYKWYESPRFWKDMETYLPQLKRIYLAGGEPFLIDGQFELLNLCVEKGYAQNITLEYNSNITLLSGKMLSIWEHFQKVEIGVSIDGIGQVNDYIRHPSKWETVAQNLRLLDQARGNFKLWWAATIQIYNLLHLPDMMLWIIRQEYRRVNKTIASKEILTPHPLNDPNFLSIKAFPEKSKIYIAEFFQKSKISARDEIMNMGYYDDSEKDLFYRRFCNVLDHYVRLMNRKNAENLNDKFWKYTNKLDQIYGTSFREICPETYDLMVIK